MKKKQIKAPDGSVIDFYVPENADYDTVRAAAQAAAQKYVESNSVMEPPVEAAAPVAEAAPAAPAPVQEAPQPAPEAAPQPPEDASRDEELSFWQKVGGGLDIGANLVTSAVSAPAAGLAGLAGAAYGAIDGQGETIETANKWQDWVSQKMTWDIESEAGQRAIQTVAPALMEADATMKDGIMWAANGNPAVAAALETTALGALEVLGFKALRSSTKAANNAAKLTKQTRKAMEEMGVKPDQKHLVKSLDDAIVAESPGARGQSIEVVENAMRSAKEAQSAKVRSLYKQAKEADTFVDVNAARDVAQGVRQSLQDDLFDFTDQSMSEVARALDKLENLDTVRATGGSAVTKSGAVRLTAKLGEIDAIRKMLNRAIDTPAKDTAAAYRLKNALDGMLDNSIENLDLTLGKRIPFGKEALSGDPAGLQLWKDARAASGKLKDLYTKDRAIKAMIDKEMSVEDVAASLFGKSARGARQDAAGIVRKIREASKGDPAVMDALRAEVMFNVMQPVLTASDNALQPALATMSRNYRYLKTNSPSLLKELDLDKGPIELMSRIGRTASELPTNRVLDKFGDLFPRFLASRFGHEIAKKGFQQNFLKKVFVMMTGGDRVSKKAILRDVAGIDGDLPLFQQKPKLLGELTAASLPTAMQEIVEEAEKP